MEYVTKWVEEEALPRAIKDFVIHCMFQIFVRYGLTRDIITDVGPQFVEFEIQTLRIAQQVGLDLNEAQSNRLQQINEPDGIRFFAFQHIVLIQQQRARWHDALIKKKFFHEGDCALLYDSRFQDFLGKLQTRWLGPYEIQKVHDNDTITLTTIDRSGHTLKENGHRVRLYRKPITRKSFYQQLREDFNM
eukprot:PITA_22156